MSNATEIVDYNEVRYAGEVFAAKHRDSVVWWYCTPESVKSFKDIVKKFAPEAAEQFTVSTLQRINSSVEEPLQELTMILLPEAPEKGPAFESTFYTESVYFALQRGCSDYLTKCAASNCSTETNLVTHPYYFDMKLCQIHWTKLQTAQEGCCIMCMAPPPEDYFQACENCLEEQCCQILCEPCEAMYPWAKKEKEKVWCATHSQLLPSTNPRTIHNMHRGQHVPKDKTEQLNQMVTINSDGFSTLDFVDSVNAYLKCKKASKEKGNLWMKNQMVQREKQLKEAKIILQRASDMQKKNDNNTVFRDHVLKHTKTPRCPKTLCFCCFICLDRKDLDKSCFDNKKARTHNCIFSSYNQTANEMMSKWWCNQQILHKAMTYGDVRTDTMTRKRFPEQLREVAGDPTQVLLSRQAIHVAARACIEYATLINGERNMTEVKSENDHISSEGMRILNVNALPPVVRPLAEMQQHRKRKQHGETRGNKEGKTPAKQPVVNPEGPQSEAGSERSVKQRRKAAPVSVGSSRRADHSDDDIGGSSRKESRTTKNLAKTTLSGGGRGRGRGGGGARGGRGGGSANLDPLDDLLVYNTKDLCQALHCNFNCVFDGFNQKECLEMIQQGNFMAMDFLSGDNRIHLPEPIFSRIKFLLDIEGYKATVRVQAAKNRKKATSGQTSESQSSATSDSD